MKIAILPGDGIGPEIVAEAVKVLNVLDLKFETESALVGGAAFDAHGHPLPEATLKLAMASDAVLFGAVGDWKYDTLERPLRPEQAILGLRSPVVPGVGLVAAVEEYGSRFAEASKIAVRVEAPAVAQALKHRARHALRTFARTFGTLMASACK